MPESNDLINLEQRIQKMCTKYASLKKENAKLRQLLLFERESLAKVREENDVLKQRLKKSALANAVIASSGDIESAKKTIRTMIKDIDRCIKYLYQ